MYAATGSVPGGGATMLPPISPSRGAVTAPTAASASASTATLSSPSSHPQLVALRKIDALSEQLQKEGKLLESLQCFEKSLILRGHIFGLDSVEVWRACRSVGELSNFLALTFLEQQPPLYDVALELLKKAELLTQKHMDVRAVTFNNMACYYRKRGKLRTALNYCRRALGIEAKCLASSTSGGQQGAAAAAAQVQSADTHLNACTILSELQRHEKAIVHARIALKLLLMELFGNFQQEEQQQLQAQQQQQQQQQQHELGPADHELLATGQAPAAAALGSAGSGVSNSIESLRARLPADRVAVLAIAYHNLAVQEEFLGREAASLASYEKASRVVETHLGSAHPLVASLRESHRAAKKKMERKQQQQQQQQHATTVGPTSPAAAASGGGMKRTASSSSSLLAHTKGHQKTHSASQSRLDATVARQQSQPQLQQQQKQRQQKTQQQQQQQPRQQSKSQQQQQQSSLPHPSEADEDQQQQQQQQHPPPQPIGEEEQPPYVAADSDDAAAAAAAAAVAGEHGFSEHGDNYDESTAYAEDADVGPDAAPAPAPVEPAAAVVEEPQEGGAEEEEEEEEEVADDYQQ